MSDVEQILAVDVGTQSVRALVFDAAGVLIAGVRMPIEPFVSPQPGWAEQDSELYWRTLGDACRQVLANPAVRRDAIAGLTVTTHRRDRRGRTTAATGDRLAGSAPNGRAAVHRWRDRARLPGAGPARHRRRLHG